MPTRRVTSKARSSPRRALSVPLADRTSAPDGDEDVAERETARIERPGGAPPPPIAPCREHGAADQHERAQPAGHPGEEAGEGPEQVAALGQPGRGNGRGERGDGDDAGGEGRGKGQHHGRGVPGPPPRQQIDRAEGEPGHVQDGPEQIEDPEGGGRPAGRGGEPQRRRRDHEEPERERPRQLVAPPAEQPAVKGGQREGGRDEHGGRGQRAVKTHHRRQRRGEQCFVNIRTRGVA